MEKNYAQKLGRDLQISKVLKEVGKSLHMLKQDLGKVKPNMKQKNKDTCQKAREELIKAASNAYLGKKNTRAELEQRRQASIKGIEEKMKLLLMKFEPRIIDPLYEFHYHLIDSIMHRQQGSYTIYKCLKDETKGKSRNHLRMPIISRNHESEAYNTYRNFIEGAPSIVRKHCIAKKLYLQTFDKHKRNREKNMVSITPTLMLIDKPSIDIKKGEK